MLRISSIFLLAIYAVAAQPLDFNLRFRSVKCSNFDEEIILFTFCNIKAYSRTSTVLNFGFKVLKPRGGFHFQIVVDYRYGTIFRQVLDSKVIDFCGIMDGTVFNPLLKHVFETIGESAPKLFHKCPYDGLNEFYNITMNNERARIAATFPDGIYR